MTALTNRSRGDLVRTASGKHAIVVESERRDNTCLLRFADGATETLSWWATKQPDDDTYLQMAGVPRSKYTLADSWRGLLRAHPAIRMGG